MFHRCGSKSGVLALGIKTLRYNLAVDLVKRQSEESHLGSFPGVGQVSINRKATLGVGGEAYLYEASLAYFSHLVDADHAAAAGWIELTKQRLRSFEQKGIVFASVFIPEKTSCLPEFHPMLLKHTPSATFQLVRSYLTNQPGTLFTNLDTRSLATRQGNWLQLDSHLSPQGALSVANEILKNFNLEPFPTPLLWSFAEYHGDLSGDLYLQQGTREWMVARIDEYDSTKTYDSYPEHENFNTGRTVRWESNRPKSKKTLLLIANSFCGPGDRPNNITYYLSRYFRSVTFLHSPQIPLDIEILGTFDYVLFQTNERFLNTVPSDSFTLEQIIAAGASKFQ